MRKINDIDTLKQGEPIVFISGEDVRFYEFLMKHPNNEGYVLFLNTLTQNADKFYIHSVLENPRWLIECSAYDICVLQYKYHERELEILAQRLSELSK